MICDNQSHDYRCIEQRRIRYFIRVFVSITFIIRPCSLLSTSEAIRFLGYLFVAYFSALIHFSVGSSLFRQFCKWICWPFDSVTRRKRNHMRPAQPRCSFLCVELVQRMLVTLSTFGISRALLFRIAVSSTNSYQQTNGFISRNWCRDPACISHRVIIVC